MMDAEKLIATRWSLLSRLKDWGDRESWQDFFDMYWRLIYDVAIKSGLSDAEAQDVVQEVLLGVAKKIPDFKRDPAFGSFKGWLLNATRWRIADQFRKRMPASLSAKARGDQPSPGRFGAAGARPPKAERGTATEERIADPATLDLDAVWDAEWQKNLMAAALERVKQKVSPEEVQIFDLCVVRNCPVKEVARKLHLKLWKVYFAQKKVSELLQREARKLEKQVL